LIFLQKHCAQTASVFVPQTPYRGPLDLTGGRPSPDTGYSP